MKIPQEFCGGSCNGKRENCPCPQACGWPADDDASTLLAAVAVIGVVIFLVGVIAWL